MQIRDPRYTGANRCLPCTVLNVGFAAVVAAALAAWGQVALAVVGFVVAVAVVATRGYLIPGTPQVTQRLPDTVLDSLGKTAKPAAAADDSAVDALRRAGVLTADARTTQSVLDAVESTAREYATDRDSLVDAVQAVIPSVDSVSVNRGLGGGENWFAQDGAGNTLRQWEDRSVAALDVAAAELLSERVPGWADLPRKDRRTALALVRYDATACPTCGSAFETPDGPNHACCGGRLLAGVRRCGECGYALVNHHELSTEEPTIRTADDRDAGGVDRV